MGKDRKIDYPFVALPRWICTSEYYHSPSMFIFLSWIFSRISFGRRSIPINNQMLDLDVGEFVFGRAVCSAETGISEQSLRTLIKSLSLQEILQKVATKSTNRFTVYKIFWSRLSENSNQQTNPQPTNNPPADNHNQEEEYKNIESKQGLLPHGTLLQVKHLG